MKCKKLYLLFIFTLVFWLVSWNGKIFFSEFFESPNVQYGFSVVIALSLSIGLLWSCACFFCKEASCCKTKWSCLGFSLLFFLILGNFLFSMWIVSSSRDALDGVFVENRLPKLLAQLNANGANEKNTAIAGAIYRFWGVAIAYRTNENSLIVYQPSEKDKKDWEQNQACNETARSIKEVLSNQLKTLFCTTCLFVTLFAFVFLMGLIRMACAK